jgi:hypothetical protein
MFNKKILCIGIEIEDTDHSVSDLARTQATVNRGLISSADFVVEQPGYYHTTVVDLSPGDIAVNLAPQFDRIIMLDQAESSWPHWKSLVNTFRLMMMLEKNGYDVEFRNNAGIRRVSYWHDQLATNPSLCLYPFINLINDYGSVTMCQKQKTPITKADLITDWATDPAFKPIRDNMLNGIQIPDKCGTCYQREELGQESARQFESLEWAMQLGLNTVEELSNIKHPVLYEIRPSNKCNIMCRMCDDKHSHLIERENILLGIPVTTDTWKMQDFPYHMINFDTAERIYWGGGEPTVMPELYEFLRRCIQKGQVDFELCIGTNALKLSDRLMDLVKEFPRVNFSVSFDGYGRINDYIRWGTDFDTLRRNCFRILEQGHNLGLQTVPSMWNATRLHEVYEFYDRDFPGCVSLVQPAGAVDSFMGPWHNPLREQVLESMYRCRETRVYYNGGRNTNDLVEEIISRFENHPSNPELVSQFFAYNDRLDQARGSRLIDYIPELEKARPR